MIIAKFENEHSLAIAFGLTQWDRGQKLEIQGLNLPSIVEVHFAILNCSKEAKRKIAHTIDSITVVDIPDSLLQQPYNIIAYIYISNEYEGETIYTIHLPIRPRQRPENQEDLEYNEDKLAEILEQVRYIVNSKPDAREIEIRKSDIAIQYRYKGDTEWKDLVNLDDIKGDVASQEELNASVAKWLEAHPLEEKDPTIPDWVRGEVPKEITNMEIEEMLQSIGGLV